MERKDRIERARNAADNIGRELSSNSMMPPEISGVSDMTAEFAADALRALASAHEATIASLSEALAEAEKKGDDAAIGRSFMASFEQIVTSDGPYEGYAPAEDPAEIVLDLYHDLLEAQDAGWQSIETAPKDGTAVIVCDASRDSQDPIIGEAYCNEARGGWWWANTSDAQLSAEPIDPPPTHWRPLPAPPRDLSQGGQHG